MAAYTRGIGQQPWWFQLLAAGSDDSEDEDYEPPPEPLVRQRAVEPVQMETTYTSDESDGDESVDITHTDDESDTESEHESDDDGFIVY
jgi:hypothetical protein